MIRGANQLQLNLFLYIAVLNQEPVIELSFVVVYCGFSIIRWMPVFVDFVGKGEINYPQKYKFTKIDTNENKRIHSIISVFNYCFVLFVFVFWCCTTVTSWGVGWVSTNIILFVIVLSYESVIQLLSFVAL